MNSALDFSFDEEQRAVAEALERFCARHAVEELARQSNQPFPRELWRALCALGVFASGAPSQEAGGVLSLCAICETLGHNVFPGPVADSFLAVAVLPAPEAAAVIDGSALVAVNRSHSGLLPWGLEADIFLAIDANGISRAKPASSMLPVQTLGGETWGRCELTTTALLENSPRGLLVGNIATAAYLAALALRLIFAASDHAALRRQFGRTLGEFQAVAHPLADCAIGATAARHLARAAACHADQQAADAEATRLAAGAALSANRAALAAVYTCHQVFAAIGVTLDGPVFHLSRRIRQLASQSCTEVREQNLLLAHAGLAPKVTA
tara:strand:- start:6964 stop:7938 length:975 start_codon:yes stop_codon:yes gene_type:complete